MGTTLQFQTLMAQGHQYICLNLRRHELGGTDYERVTRFLPELSDPLIKAHGSPEAVCQALADGEIKLALAPRANLHLNARPWKLTEIDAEGQAAAVVGYITAEHALELNTLAKAGQAPGIRPAHFSIFDGVAVAMRYLHAQKLRAEADGIEEQVQQRAATLPEEARAIYEAARARVEALQADEAEAPSF